MIILSVVTEELRNGMVLAGNVCTDAGQILGREGDSVTDGLIKVLQNFHIKNVLVYMEESVSSGMVHGVAPQDGFIITEQDFSKNLKEIFQNEEKFKSKKLLETLNGIIKELQEKEKIISMLGEIKENNKRLYQHLIGVALLSQQLAIWLGCAEAEIEMVTLAGLLHDIGLAHVKKMSISFKEELEIRSYEKHVTDANYTLRRLKIDENIIRGISSHHERIDGNGFPLRIFGSQINQISRIISIADTYDTYTMRNKGEYGYSALQALQMLKEDGSRRVDSGMVRVFVDHILDTILLRQVGLSDGTVGKVMMTNKYDLLYPVVECKDKMIDLSKTKRVWVEELL